MFFSDATSKQLEVHGGLTHCRERRRLLSITMGTAGGLMTHQTYPGLEKRPYTLATYETASHHHDGNKKKTYWKDVKQILLMENMTQQDIINGGIFLSSLRWQHN